jgi:hypothetical protein
VLAGVATPPETVTGQDDPAAGGHTPRSQDDGAPGGLATRRQRVRMLFPDDCTWTSAWWLVAVAAVGAAVAGLRLGHLGMDTLWAEDGSIFYTRTARTVWSSLFQPYAGYLHAGPWALASIATRLPVSWAAAAVAVADAVTLGALAAVVYCAARPVIARWYLRLLPALFLVACSVAGETTGSIANLQWPLSFVAVLVLLWNPRRPAPLVVSCIVLLFATMSSPFGLLLAPLAVVRIAAFGRDRGSLPAVAMLTGVTVQTYVMLTTTNDRASYHQVPVGPLARAFIQGSVGLTAQGVRIKAVPQLLAGLVVLVAIVVAALLVALGGDTRRAVVAAILLTGSLVLFAAPAVASGILLVGSHGAGRYYVAPAMLVASAVTILADAAWDRSGWRDRASRRAGGWRDRLGGRQPVAAALTAVLTGLLMLSAATSYRTPQPARKAVPNWSAGLAAARHACAAGARTATILISPPARSPWRVRLDCRFIER